MGRISRNLTKRRARKVQEVFKMEFEGRTFTNSEFVEVLDSEEVVFQVWDSNYNCMEVLFYVKDVMSYEIKEDCTCTQEIRS